MVYSYKEIVYSPENCFRRIFSAVRKYSETLSEKRTLKVVILYDPSFLKGEMICHFKMRCAYMHIFIRKRLKVCVPKFYQWLPLLAFPFLSFFFYCMFATLNLNY